MGGPHGIPRRWASLPLTTCSVSPLAIIRTGVLAAGGRAAGRRGFPEKPRAELSQGWPPAQGRGFSHGRRPELPFCLGLSSRRSTSRAGEES